MHFGLKLKDLGINCMCASQPGLAVMSFASHDYSSLLDASSLIPALPEGREAISQR